jgi:hypothetical protein
MFDGLLLLILVGLGGFFCPFYLLNQHYALAGTCVLAFITLCALMNSDKILKPRVTTSVQRTSKIGRFEFSEPVNVQVTKTEHPWTFQDTRYTYYVDLGKQSWVDLVPGERERVENV